MILVSCHLNVQLFRCFTQDRQHKKPAQTLMRVHICKYTPILYQSYWQLASQSKQMLIKSQTELPLITYTLHKKYMAV